MRKVKSVSRMTRMLGVVVLVCMAVLHLQVGATTQDLHGPPDVVKEGGYNVLALGSDLPACMRQDVYHLLRERYGDQLLLWGVQESDRLEYVYAYPEGDRNFADALIAFVENYPPEASCDLTSDPMPTVQILDP